MASQTKSSSKPEPRGTKRVRLSYTAVAINLDLSSKYIVISLDDKTVHVFNPDGELLHVLNHDAIVWSLALRDNILLCGEVGGRIRSWDLVSGSMESMFTGHLNTVRCLVFCGPTGFVSASRDTMLKIWSLKTDQNAEPCTATLSAHATSIVSLSFDPASSFVASGSQDGICRVWDLAGQVTSVSTLSGHEGDVRSVALFTSISANDSRQVIRVVTGGADGQVKVWDAVSGSLIADLDGHNGLVGHVLAVTNDSREARTLITAGVDGTIKAWEMSSTPRLRWVQKNAHKNGVTSVHSNGEHLVSGGADSKVRVWELQTGRMIKKLGNKFDAVYRVACKQDSGHGFIVVSRQDSSTVLDIFPVS